MFSLRATGGIVACQRKMWNGKTGEAKPKPKVGVENRTKARWQSERYIRHRLLCAHLLVVLLLRPFKGI